MSAVLDRAAPSEQASACAHCGLPCPPGQRFCCPGCAAARDAIEQLGLGTYYARRVLDPAARPPRPDDSAERRDLTRYVTTSESGAHTLELAVDGLQCGACVWLIEQILSRTPGLDSGRVNMTTRRLRLTWHGPDTEAARFVAAVERLGYRLMPFDPRQLAAAHDRTGRALLRALAVAGFAAGNVMLASIGVWAGAFQGMGQATRDMLHLISALVAVPAILYAGRPFFASAFAALRRGRTNMDVPITIGVAIVTTMSLVETLRGGPDTYFDSAIALLFFLLIGRVLDHRARFQARASAEQLLALQSGDVTLLAPSGETTRCPAAAVEPGATILVGRGERVGVDGEITAGQTLLDTSLVTGESVPAPGGAGGAVFQGTINLGDPITVRATRTGQGTLLAECVRLIEAAEARRSRYVVLADRVARRYAPVVHITALLTFLYWWGIAGQAAGPSLLTACAVLIITCPCALALAVPAVQVIATGRLMQAGILLKSPTALERLAEADDIVFDKTGTLTLPSLALHDGADPEPLRLAACLAVASRHPLARALSAASGPVAATPNVAEVPGQGLRAPHPQGEIRLGNRNFAGNPAAPPATGPELWLARPGHAPTCFTFGERLRPDAAATIAALRQAGYRLSILSGDRAESVAPIASALGIDSWEAACTPTAKVARIETLKSAGRRVLMVGDGLNDGPCLAAAHVSVSPSTAADLSQNVADAVFQGERLFPVLALLRMARRTRTLMRENLGLSLGYNLVMVPIAIAGLVTPWIAAAAMSASSLLVLGNSLRARGRRIMGS